MICPQCKTENRDERAECYHCGQDLSMVRAVVARSRESFNRALEHAERSRPEEAITELKHALTLDSSFVNAWVVLGTIYAKQERFAEAEEAWKKALAISPTFERSHEYLLKAQKLRAAAPAIARLRTLAAGLALAVIALGAAAVALVIYDLRPDPAAERLEKALELKEQNKIGEALAESQAAAHAALAPATTRKFASAIAAELAGELEARMGEVRAAVASNDSASALGAIDRLAALGPPAEMAEELKAMRAAELDRIAAGAEADLVAFREGRKSFDAIAAASALAQALLGEDPRKEKLAGLAAEARAEHEEKVLGEARERLRTAGDLNEAAKAADALAAANPSLKDKIEASFQNLLETRAKTIAQSADEALARGDATLAAKRLVEIETLYQGVDRAAPAALVGELRGKIERNQLAARLADIQRAHAEKKWEEVLDSTRDLEKAGWNEEEKRTLSALRADAIDRFSADFWNWCQSLDVEFEVGRITHEQALRMIDNYELALSARKSAFERSHILFRAAAAYFYRMNDPAKAAEILARLEKEYPDAQILSYRAYKNFKEKAGTGKASGS